MLSVIIKQNLVVIFVQIYLLTKVITYQFLSRWGNIMVGMLMGTLTIAFMNTGLTSLGVSSSMQTTINGLFLLAILIISANEARVAEYFENKKIANAARKKMTVSQ